MSASTLDPSHRIKFRLGNSGLKVSQIILGCMSYGSKEWGPWVLEEEEAIRHIKFAYDAGIQTFDTANVHGAVGRIPGVNSLELYLGDPDNVGYVNQHGLSRKHIFDSVQASLKRLQLDYIDAIALTTIPQFRKPQMQALHDVVKAGWVRYIGMSSCYAWQFHVMQNYAITHNLTPFISMQNHYNLIHREEEREMMPSLKHFGVGSIPWSPLARGALTRPYTGPQAEKTIRQASDDFPSDVYFTLGAGSKEVVARDCEEHNKTMAQVSLAWLLTKA
ncbi:Aldo/keto reductase [Mycena olivaceomarginata]|nr:Aldo/keto reductase [Mycena olivaceomarginata]